jgi:hypothetical protein
MKRVLFVNKSKSSTRTTGPTTRSQSKLLIDQVQGIPVLSPSSITGKRLNDINHSATSTPQNSTTTATTDASTDVVTSVEISQNIALHGADVADLHTSLPSALIADNPSVILTASEMSTTDGAVGGVSVEPLTAKTAPPSTVASDTSTTVASTPAPKPESPPTTTTSLADGGYAKSKALDKLATLEAQWLDLQAQCADADLKRKQLHRKIYPDSDGTAPTGTTSTVIDNKSTTVSDPAFTPKPFSGRNIDDDAETWCAYFERYCKLRKVDLDTKLQLFQILLIDDAAAWLTSQPEKVTRDYTLLMTAFSKRFKWNETQCKTKLNEWWVREQQTGESVAAYVTTMRNMAERVKIRDEYTIRAAIERGLRTPIRRHVMQSGAKTLDDVINAAQVAEASTNAYGDDASSATLSEIRQMVTSMLTQQSEMKASQEQLKIDNSQLRQQLTTSAAATVAAVHDHGRENTDGRPSVKQSDGPNYGGRFQPNRSTSSYRRGGFNLRGGPTNRSAPIDNSISNNGTTSGNDCGNCGYQHERGNCPAYGVVCFNCGKNNHFSRKCRAPRNQQQAYQQAHSHHP